MLWSLRDPSQMSHPFGAAPPAKDKTMPAGAYLSINPVPFSVNFCAAKACAALPSFSAYLSINSVPFSVNF
ncbi:hypothetical protein D3C86_1877470 [compost metagenome]